MGLLKKELLSFQKIGAQNLSSNFHHLLADEPGLGKTLQALAACAFHKFKRVGIVCPASVRSGWKQEINECGLHLSNFHIDSYEAATADRFPAGPYDAFILDEAHYLKNAESQRTQAIFGNENGLARKAKFIWPMTGTPFLNRPREIYPVLKCLHLEALKKTGYDTFDKFAQHFCGAHWDGRTINTKGASHLEELRSLLSGFMTRRTIDQVMPELPPILLAHTPIELTAEEMVRFYDIE